MGMNPGVKAEAASLEREGKKLSGQATMSPVMEDLMRLGYGVRGLVYGVIGLLALPVAIGLGGKLNDTQGAIASLGSTPLGGVFLYVILLGLIGYALWSVVRAVLDPQHLGSDQKAIVERIGFGVSGISYGLLAVATYGLITSRASAAQNGAQGAQTQQTTASILSHPWGPWVVGIAALIVIGIGVAEIVHGLQPDFKRQFHAYALSRMEQVWIDRMGRFGTAARGVVFSLIGLFLFVAAYQQDPKQAKGIDGVLTALLHQSYGPFLLAIVSLGLIAFGMYSIMSGFWLRLKR